MSAPRWTPGPWLGEPRGNMILIFAGDPSTVENRPVVCFMGDGSSEEMKANFHLIELAPKLYEALDAIIAADERGQGLPFAEAMARALIIMAKARGEK